MINQNPEEFNSLRHAIASSGLPVLTGNYQEIGWANALRIDRFIESNRILALLHQQPQEGSAPHDREEMVFASMRLRDKTEAAWWIEQRHTDTQTLLQGLTHRSYAMESGGG